MTQEMDCHIIPVPFALQQNSPVFARKMPQSIHLLNRTPVVELHSVWHTCSIQYIVQYF